MNAFISSREMRCVFAFDRGVCRAGPFPPPLPAVISDAVSVRGDYIHDLEPPKIVSEPSPSQVGLYIHYIDYMYYSSEGVVITDREGAFACVSVLSVVVKSFTVLVISCSCP